MNTLPDDIMNIFKDFPVGNYHYFHSKLRYCLFSCIGGPDGAEVAHWKPISQKDVKQFLRELSINFQSVKDSGADQTTFTHINPIKGEKKKTARKLPLSRRD